MSEENLLVSLVYMPGRAVLAAVFLALTCALPRGASQEDRKAKAFQEFRPALKNAADDPKGLELTGPDAEQCVHFEPNGIRIDLPADYDGPPGFSGERPDTGLIVPITVKGDFDITVAFEILKEPDRADAGNPQTRLSLDACVDRTRHVQTTVSRRMSPWSAAPQYLAWMRRQDADGGDEQKHKAVDARAQTGRIRLVREGDLVSYFGADGADGPFTLFEQFPFSKDPLEDVRVTASTGGPRAALEARITNIVVRGESLSKTSDIVASTERSSRTWIIAAAGILLLATLLALAFFLRSRAPATPQSSARRH
jgi:hypothetical protein